MCAFKVQPNEAEILEYAVGDNMSVQIIADAASIMRRWGICLPEKIEIVYYDDVNCHMCKVEESDT